MKKILLVLILAFPLFAANLQLKNGSVAAHTQMVMDKTIDPLNNSLNADLTIQESDITTLRGKFWVEMELFKSDNNDRDKNMYKDIEVDKFKLASYTISSVIKNGDNSYTISGILNFHGKEKPINAQAKIVYTAGVLTIDASSMILVSDFGIKMPCMVFMCVRDQVDLSIKADFSAGL